MTESNYDPTTGAASQTSPIREHNFGGAARGEASPNAAGGFRERAEQALETTRDRASAALHSGEDYVRENPLPVVIGAVALGLVIGLSVGGGHRETFKERYVDEPLDHAHGVLLGAVFAIAAAARRLFRSAADCTQDTADAVRHQAKPLAKAVKRVGRRMHLS